jgi:hypothetical protein
VRRWSEPQTYVTEETLPDPGSRKRIPSLHVLAERYFGGQQWEDACRFYQMILDEAGEEGLEAKEGGKRRAGRSFFECAKRALREDRPDQVEVNLQKAEQLGVRSPRHDFLRRKVVKAELHEKMARGDTTGALQLYEKYQSMYEQTAGGTDEDERIWFGEELAKVARQAFEQEDDITFREVMARLETIAPMNTEYRALKAEAEGNAKLFENIALVVGSAVAAVVLLSLVSRWRARARIGRVGKKNPYLDDDDDI